MSTLLVEVTTIEELNPHSKADLLEIAKIKGWQVVVQKGAFTQGQKVLYFLPDTLLETEVSDALGVTKYLSKGRVRAIKLRGEPSFGFVVPAQETDVLGDNLAARFNATKWEPPVTQVEDAESEDPMFPRYLDIEALRNFPRVLVEGEEVVYTEKIHGTNCGLCIVKQPDSTLVRMARSHSLRRKQPEDISKSRYWFAWGIPEVEAFMLHMAVRHNAVAIYGEVYGSGVQKKFDYDTKNSRPAFRAFDVWVDGNWLPFEEFEKLMKHFNVPMVPVLERGSFSIKRAEELAEGKSTLGEGTTREGVVVRPIVPRYDPKIGFVALKQVSTAYLLKADEAAEKGEAGVAH